MYENNKCLLFTKLPWPEDQGRNFQFSSQIIRYNTVRRIPVNDTTRESILVTVNVLNYAITSLRRY